MDFIKMKTFRCGNCKRTTTKKSNIVLVTCLCGYPMELIKTAQDIIDEAPSYRDNRMRYFPKMYERRFKKDGRNK